MCVATPARNLDFSCKKSPAKELSLKTESEVNSDSVFVVNKLLRNLKINHFSLLFALMGRCMIQWCHDGR